MVALKTLHLPRFMVGSRQTPPLPGHNQGDPRAADCSAIYTARVALMSPNIPHRQGSSTQELRTRYQVPVISLDSSDLMLYQYLAS